MSEEPESLEQRLLALITGPNYRPMKPRMIAKRFDLDADQRVQLRRMVKKLVRTGKLTYGKNHFILPPSGTAVAKLRKPKTGAGEGPPPSAGEQVPETETAESNVTPLDEDVTDEEAPEAATEAPPPREKPRKEKYSGEKSKPGIVGTFRRTSKGFGFVRPLKTSVAAGRDLDIFVAAEDAADAASGDVVRVRVSTERNRTRNSQGRIVEVMERQTHRFVGTYFETGGGAFVLVDGTIFSQPISVGDPGAKNAVVDDKVVFEMVRFPTYWQSGEGVIVEVLGARGTPGIDTLSILREFNLPEGFPDDVIEDARRRAEEFDESNIGERTDFTKHTIITIDPVDARDFDDAISLEKLENGNWLLGVHIADVSHFVRSKSPLDREARERATSVYLPDRVIPMIPEIISNGLASLQPDRVRYVKSALMEFTPEGIRTHTALHTGAIRSCRRFTYEEVDEYLADREAWRAKLTPQVHELLGWMHELAMTLRGRRIEAGALELTMPEIKVDLDRDGRVVGAHRTTNTVSHQMIEECMLAANMATAETIEEAGWLFLRRVHESPDPRKLKLLESFVDSLGLPADGLESRFALQKLLRDVEGRPEQQAVNFALLRSLQRARYAPIEEGHYALASDCYCHFTSPIRRYPDLTIHRLVDCLLQHHKPRNNLEELASLGDHCSDRERRAEAAERELTKVKLLNYLNERLGEEMEAVVTGVEEFGLFAQGTDVPAEGLIHASSLADDIYHYDRSSHSLTGRREGNAFRLGDRVRVVVARVDVDRRELDFRIVDRLKRAPSKHVAKPERGDAKRRPTHLHPPHGEDRGRKKKRKRRD